MASASPSSAIKDPDAVLDYSWDWGTNWLASGETISTRTIVAESGITVDSSEIYSSSQKVRVWLSGGTAGQDYTVTCRITTSDNRTDDSSVKIMVREQ